MNDEKLKELMKNSWSYRVYITGSGGTDDTQTYVLVDESGAEIPAVLVSEETMFDATPNDIREGKVVVTDAGVTVGTKDIPAYNVSEGVRIITAGSALTIPLRINDKYDYTKLQVIVCPFNKSTNDSVFSEQVVINDALYPVASTEKITDVTKDSETKSINLGVVNERTIPILLRYFSYKEIY